MKTNKINLKTIVSSLAVIALLSTAGSCVNDLERAPITETTSSAIYSDFANYPNALAKLYGGLAHGGNASAGGNADISGIDGNFSQYTRQLFTLQDLPTDQAVIAWNDGTLQTVHKMTWDSSNEFIAAMYYRLYTEIAFCNEFLRNTTDEKLASNNITGDNLTEAKYMRAEARFLRAQSYYHALDLFGNVPFADETYLPGSPTPPQRIDRANLFKYVETELLACATDLKAARTNQYGRADQAAAWTLLAKLYLNAGVYTGTTRYADVITYANKVIGAGYSLKSDYQSLFLADNDKNNPEVIFPVVFDGVHIKTFGGTTYMVHAAVGGKMAAKDFGINGGWGGLRTTKAYVNLFGGAGTADKRGNFYTNGQTLEINDLSNFADGYAFIKYKNITSTGAEGSDGPTNGSGDFVDADIPLYRLADVYLMYAEATVRGGGGNMATALGYINAIRKRAGALPVTTINADFILDERGRELGWEMTRRTDLIRYGKFTTASYLWPWKGGIKDGDAVADYRNLYPIPAKDLVANPNLVQNTGY
ncbi:RagB/SusD family nutrient uptake outer membrane protein [uncultured Chryseobacterium sp.]|uniref:RagB/SusD family nutrient uptake outer membrane protein n=1 Tax=uncultured Chryseobacterium sp. TaxID=259322 RepID=UPI00261EBF60|nr:RagB/SusD family nutrient uptake outer membrane protein [uncultured Chryseobacterium sp.]